MNNLVVVAVHRSILNDARCFVLINIVNITTLIKLQLLLFSHRFNAISFMLRNLLNLLRLHSIQPIDHSVVVFFNNKIQIKIIGPFKKQIEIVCHGIMHETCLR